MSILAYAPTAGERPPLPSRPIPHERDGRQPAPSEGRPHPQQSTAAVSITAAFLTQALTRVVEQQIGPRRPGAIYENVDGAFEVLAVVTDPAMAREMLNRRCARFAVIVRDIRRPDGQPFIVGSAWTTSDWLRRAGHNAPADEREQVTA
ncbi:hypothetical protein ABZ953_39095 [Streptomyces sp. NPDC046465]|uniref:hypothetical protein n=1 Tax=Streptomyces sp. NPDC046465 TaxID=3155810 RepID=UPI00340E9742